MKGNEALCVAYLVNQYPKISHSFIRRELQAVEALGARVERFSLRSSGEQFPDAEDRLEFDRTRVVLQEGFIGLFAALAATLLTRPAKFAAALALTLRIGWRSDRGLGRNFAYLAEACVLLRWFAQSGVQHVHAHFATNPAAVVMLCRALGGPSYSFTAHGPDDFDLASFLSLPLKIERAAFVLSVSSFGRSQLFRWCGISEWPKIHVLHPGLDERFLAQSAVPVPQAPRLVCIGRLHPQKGQMILLEAIRQLISEGVTCEAVLVGDGPMRGDLERRISELNLQSTVTLAGSVPTGELARHILDSRVVVLPSLAENLPSVILEAFALHRPVIATYIGGIPEVVDADCGWLVPAGSAEALARAMRNALSAEPSTLDRMGHAGAARVQENFRSHCAARRLLELIRIAVES